MDQKERYIITMEDGEQINAVARSFAECLQLFGEERVIMIEKLEYVEPEEEKE